MRKLILAFVPVLAMACSSTPPVPPTLADFDPAADLTNPDSFYAMPYPSDLRLTADGTPDLRGFPNNLAETIIEGLRATAMQRHGFPQMPVAYFHFSAELAPEDPSVVVPADASQSLLLVDVDPNSPERGKLFPVVAGTPAADRYLLDGTLEVAARVGVVLHESRTYAFVVTKSLLDANGRHVAAPDAFTALESDAPPAAGPALAAWKLYQPLWSTLAQIGVDQSNVAIGDGVHHRRRRGGHGRSLVERDRSVPDVDRDL